MVFSSLQFILFFMPTFFICYYVFPQKCRNFILLSGSLIFYFVGTIEKPYYLILLIIMAIMDFFIGQGMEKKPQAKKIYLAVGVFFHLACLFIFKYSSFMMDEIVRIFNMKNLSMEIVLPIGISFYTFQGISYITDVYRCKVKAEDSLLNYMVYITMFEQLIAGPIVIYGQIRMQLQRRSITLHKVISGLGTFVFGLGLKVLLANPLGKLWNQTLAIGFDSISTILAWMAIFAFSFQIYLDFFGYSLMAIGLGKMLGFKLPANFNHPYTSLTMTEFFRRWHITLSSWFKEYVYIPLGGNRNGWLKTIRNLMIVWLLTGIWHGAGYNFLCWGFVLFVIILMEKLFYGKFLSEHALLGHLYMVPMISVTWAIFAVTDMNQLAVLFSRLFPFFGKGMWSIFRYDYLKYWKMYYPFLIIGLLFSTKLPYQFLKKIKNKAVLLIFLIIVFGASLYCMYRGLDDPFLYFRF